MPKHSTFRHPSYIAFSDSREDERRARFHEMELRRERLQVIETKRAFLGGGK